MPETGSVKDLILDAARNTLTISGFNRGGSAKNAYIDLLAYHLSKNFHSTVKYAFSVSKKWNISLVLNDCEIKQKALDLVISFYTTPQGDFSLSEPINDFNEIIFNGEPPDKIEKILCPMIIFQISTGAGNSFANQQTINDLIYRAELLGSQYARKIVPLSVILNFGKPVVRYWFSSDPRPEKEVRISLAELPSVPNPTQLQLP